MTYSSKSGFTMIELLIVLVTMGVLYTVGYANYRSFARQKQLEAVATDVRSMLRLAQEYSLSGKNPSATFCNDPSETISGYTFQIAGTDYSLVSNCSSGETFLDTSTTRTLPIGVTFQPSMGTSVTFYSLGKGASANTTFRVQRSTQHIDISVTRAGEIR